jgi:hypothetical protein
MVPGGQFLGLVRVGDKLHNDRALLDELKSVKLVRELRLAVRAMDGRVAGTADADGPRQEFASEAAILLLLVDAVNASRDQVMPVDARFE